MNNLKASLNDIRLMDRLHRMELAKQEENEKRLMGLIRKGNRLINNISKK